VLSISTKIEETRTVGKNVLKGLW